MTEKREQVAKQCDAIVHLCKQIESVHFEYAKLFREGMMDGITDQVGHRTAGLMEQLGNFLNSVDAVGNDDEWLTPVFEKAQELWPQSSAGGGSNG